MSLAPLCSTKVEIRSAVSAAKAKGLSVGFVPTMGALHEGHAELIRTARRECGFVVVSIFVNPTQFGPNEDLAKYPRTLDADRTICTDAGADVIYYPTVDAIYPPGAVTWVEVKELDQHLCGASRPGHFRGVCTVVATLFNQILPDYAYFGQKDGQQLRIIQRMVRDLAFPVTIRACPTVREADGLAMSSRNRYLNPQERAAAPGIYRALVAIRERILRGEVDGARLASALAADLGAIPGARVDYARIVDDESLQPLSRVDRPALAAVAVVLGTTRLIDNVTIR
jgi:pantoate--beta-alanine ligase